MNRIVSFSFVKKFFLILSVSLMNSALPIIPYFPPKDPRFNELKQLFLPFGKAIISATPAVIFGASHIALCFSMMTFEKTLEISMNKKELLLESIKNGDIKGFKENLLFFTHFYVVDRSGKLKSEINRLCPDEASKKYMIALVDQQKKLATTIFRDLRKLERLGFDVAKKLS